MDCDELITPKRIARRKKRSNDLPRKTADSGTASEWDEYHEYSANIPPPKPLGMLISS
jgi:hypothetical protein